MRICEIWGVAESDGRTGADAVRWARKNFHWSMGEADDVIGLRG